MLGLIAGPHVLALPCSDGIDSVHVVFLPPLLASSSQSLGLDKQSESWLAKCHGPLLLDEQGQAPEWSVFFLMNSDFGRSYFPFLWVHVKAHRRLRQMEDSIFPGQWPGTIVFALPLFFSPLPPPSLLAFHARSLPLSFFVRRLLRAVLTCRTVFPSRGEDMQACTTSLPPLRVVLASTWREGNCSSADF